jgi:hypothetical protein
MRANNLQRVFLISAAVIGLSVPLVFTHAYRTLHPEPVDVAKAFYKASYAREVRAAYAHVSAADRRVRDQAAYVSDQESFSGFALELAKRFADQIEFQVVEREISAERARLTLDYKMPAADELSALLFNWDQNKLRALPRAERRRITAAVIKSGENPISIEGRETFNLVKENGRWKIFLDWAAGITVSFAAALPVHNALEVKFLKRTIFASKDEPFQSNLKLRNRGQREIVARIDHRIEPKEYAADITMIACGFLRPLTLRPGEEREVSSAYLLDPGFPKSKALSITYIFQVESASPIKH